MTFGEKLKKARIDCALKQSDLAKLLKTTNTTISNWENGVSKPDLDTLAYICGALNVKASYFLESKLQNSEISISELNIIKKYRMLDNSGKEHVNYILERENKRIIDLNFALTNKINTRALIEDNQQPIRLINYYYRLASAGTGQVLFDEPPTKKIEVPDLPEYKNADYAIGVNGNSMEPTYYDGDLLLVEMTDTIEVGEIGIFAVDNDCYVKKLGEGELISLNPSFENIALNDTAKCMGRVIGKL